MGNVLGILIVGIGLLGLALMLAHSTFLMIATEFAAKTRGAAMSLVAFCFMGGDGLGTAFGSRIVENSSILTLFTIYGLGLVVSILGLYLSLIRVLLLPCSLIERPFKYLKSP